MSRAPIVTAGSAGSARRPLLFILAVIAAYIVLALLRHPQVVTQGRFWAEEGRVFFGNAATMPWRMALFNSFGGYLNLIANAATLIAWKCLPILYAPYFTAFVGLVFQLVPVWLLLTARDGWLQRRAIRAAGVAFMLFVPASEEIWLQVLHCQISLSLACALIVVLDTRRGWLAPGIMLLAPLTGLGPLAFIPLALLRAGIERSMPRIVQCLALIAGGAIQIGLFHVSDPGRGAAHWLNAALVAVTCREIVVPLFGTFSQTTAVLIQPLKEGIKLHPNGLFWAQPVAVLFFTPFVVAGCLYRRLRVLLWLLLANASFTGAAMYGALGGASMQVEALVGQRYVFVGEVLCGLMLLAVAALALRFWVRAAVWILVGWMLFIGAREFWRGPYIQSGPDWRPEVHKWEKDHRYSMKIWPAPWTIDIP